MADAPSGKQPQRDADDPGEDGGAEAPSEPSSRAGATEPDPASGESEADDEEEAPPSAPTAERPQIAAARAGSPAGPPRVAPRPPSRGPAAPKPKDEEDRPTDRLKAKKPGPSESGPNESGPNESGPNESGPRESGPSSPNRGHDAAEYTDTNVDTLEQQATLPKNTPRATLPEPDADATTAISPYQRHDARPAAVAAVARGARAGSTADTLHTEDEDGPTLIAQYPSPVRADEPTALMALTAEPSAPPPSVAPPTSSAPSSPALGSVAPHPLRSQFAEREAAVQAALAAATAHASDPEAFAAQRAHLFELATVGVLGAGALLAAALSIIADGGAAKLNMPLAVALFLAGLVPLQRREPVKIALLGLGGALLFIAFIAMLVI